ncbi:hypothetical protein B7494_g3976 [Chlorociboria aeruginascens]|nr:hypothetical protein B7494_g3976 [Chlorociboria aeruginascens]
MGNPEEESGRYSQGSEEQAVVKPTKTWKGYVWDTWELPQDQRWLLFKLDAFVLTFASIGYFLKNIDLTNVNNAFLSGMEEDLSMYGNQLVTSTSIYTVGYVIGQIPTNLLLTRVSPRWVIPTLELGWGISTICTSTVNSYQALYALRFLVGLFESGFYPGIHYLLGSWYTPREIGKRAMIFWLAGAIGQLFSGFLQAAAYTNLSGVGGYAGWRWLFIVDGIITIPLAVAGYLFFPNLPQSGIKTWWTTQAEHELSVQRMQAIGRAGKEKWTWAKFKRISLSWQTYLLPLLYIVWNNGGAQIAMGYWLKSFNAHPPPLPGTTFTVAQINNLPLPILGIFIFVAATWAWISDGWLRGSRWPFIYIGAAMTLLFSVLMRQMPLYKNIHGRMAVYWLSQSGFGAGPLILTWINEICSGDTEKRALLVAMGNDFAYIVQAVAPNFVWKTTDFPAAKKGYLWCIISQIILAIVTGSVQLLLWRDKRIEARAEAEAALSASRGSDSPPLEGSNLDEKKAASIGTEEVMPVKLEETFGREMPINFLYRQYVYTFPRKIELRKALLRFPKKALQDPNFASGLIPFARKAQISDSGLDHSPVHDITTMPTTQSLPLTPGDEEKAISSIRDTLHPDRHLTLLDIPNEVFIMIFQILRNSDLPGPAACLALVSRNIYPIFKAVSPGPVHLNHPTFTISVGTTTTTDGEEEAVSEHLLANWIGPNYVQAQKCWWGPITNFLRAEIYAEDPKLVKYEEYRDIKWTLRGEKELEWFLRWEDYVILHSFCNLPTPFDKGEQWWDEVLDVYKRGELFKIHLGSDTWLNYRLQHWRASCTRMKIIKFKKGERMENGAIWDTWAEWIALNDF